MFSSTCRWCTEYSYRLVVIIQSCLLEPGTIIMRSVTQKKYSIYNNICADVL